MANKYLKGGALNPVWCDEQDAEIFSESITDSIFNLLDILDINFDLQLMEGVNINVSNKRKDEGRIMCDIINTENYYEAKFNFIKNHSGTPEDLKLAREIIGLD